KGIDDAVVVPGNFFLRSVETLPQLFADLLIIVIHAADIGKFIRAAYELRFKTLVRQAVDGRLLALLPALRLVLRLRRNDIRDLFAEFFFDLFERRAGVLDRVVQEPRRNDGFVTAVFR